MKTSATRRYVPRSVQLEMALRQVGMGRRIRELRKKLGLTQPEVADRVGVTLRAYQEWEAGGGIGGPNLRKLAEVLGVQVTDITGEQQPLPSSVYVDESGRADEVVTRLDRVEMKIDRLMVLIDGMDEVRKLPEVMASTRVPALLRALEKSLAVVKEGGDEPLATEARAAGGSRAMPSPPGTRGEPTRPTVGSGSGTARDEDSPDEESRRRSA